MDVLNTYGATHDTQVIGAGQNSVEDTYAQVAAKHGRVVVTDNEPAKGYYYRSDQFELAKQGLPSLYVKRGIAVIGNPAGYGKATLDAYTDRQRVAEGKRDSVPVDYGSHPIIKKKQKTT